MVAVSNSMRVRVIRSEPRNWYGVGEEFVVSKITKFDGEDEFYPLLAQPESGVCVGHCEEVGITAAPRNKYSREIKPGVWVDCYDVIRAFNVTDPCLQHLLKKALAGGQRGHKDLGEDLRDILASAKRAVEMYEEWNAAE